MRGSARRAKHNGMALFTDGPPSSIDELAALDSQLLNVASTEGIDVTSKLELAHEEAGLDLYALLKRTSPADRLLWAVVKPNLENVAVTRGLKLWHAYRTLELVYSDAYYSQLNDRYMAKCNRFQELAILHRERLIEAGLGMVSVPVPRAAAPSLTAALGSLPDNTYYLTATWVNRLSEEGASAIPVTITTTASSFSAQMGAAPANASGWNVYVGTDPDGMALQNGVPLGVGAAWVQPVWISTAGRKPGHGQAPDYVEALPRILQRG